MLFYSDLLSTHQCAIHECSTKCLNVLSVCINIVDHTLPPVDLQSVEQELKCDKICQKGSYTYTHSFRSHFSLSFDRYNNRPTVHACTIAKSSAVCFYRGLIHGPVWRPRMLGWSVNCPARQTDGRESPQDWLVRLDIDVATF